MNIRGAILLILILGFLDIKLYPQNYPSIQNEFKSEISDFILSQKNFKEYDFCKNKNLLTFNKACRLFDIQKEVRI